jgi:hypothetical protein
VQLDTVAQAAEPVRRASRGLYLPTIAITGLAAWLSWRGWSAPAQTGVASSLDDGRFQLAGPVVLGFVLAVTILEQIRPAQRRPVFARGPAASASSASSSPSPPGWLTRSWWSRRRASSCSR